MLPTRLIRQGDAVTVLETFAFLIRARGLPQRPTVPSPLRTAFGLEALVFDPSRQSDVFVWAEDARDAVIQSTGFADQRPGLASSRVRGAALADFTFDPDRAGEPGHFLSRMMLEMADQALEEFDPGWLDDYHSVAVKLAACAYFRQAFALSRCLPALCAELAGYGVAQRFVENVLAFSGTLALHLRRQAPEQVVATYGSVMTRPMRRKIRPAFAQFESFQSEIKLIGMLAGSEPRPERHAGGEALQPQRISCT
ncbi:MAG: hypothetical protein WBF53_14600 [Litorimonas sp.]